MVRRGFRCIQHILLVTEVAGEVLERIVELSLMRNLALHFDNVERVVWFLAGRQSLEPMSLWRCAPSSHFVHRNPLYVFVEKTAHQRDSIFLVLCLIS